MILSVYFLALILLFAAIFCALWRKRYVRAIFKGPLSTFLIEFEADDRNRTHEPDACPNPPEYLYDRDSGSVADESDIPARTACGTSPSKHAPGIVALCSDCLVRLGVKS
jgi:hypothetical protein